jgi:hypothetical protein
MPETLYLRFQRQFSWCRAIWSSSWEVSDLANTIPSLDSPNSSHGESCLDIAAASSSAATVIVEDLPKVAQWQKRRRHAYATPSSRAHMRNCSAPWPLGTPRPYLLGHIAWSGMDKRGGQGPVQRQASGRRDSRCGREMVG